eukprot:s483_g5.t1
MQKTNSDLKSRLDVQDWYGEAMKQREQNAVLKSDELEEKVVSLTTETDNKAFEDKIMKYEALVSAMSSDITKRREEMAEIKAWSHMR